MRKFLPAIALLAAGCAATTTTPPPANSVPASPTPAQPAPAAQSGITAERIGQICSLPDAEREVALEKLKQETGMVLYCGNKN